MDSRQQTSPHDVVEWDFTSGSDSEPASPAKTLIDAKRQRNKKGRLERNLSFAENDQVITLNSCDKKGSYPYYISTNKLATLSQDKIP